MPEVAEVAHFCAQLRRQVVGYTIKYANLPQDKLAFPQLGKEEPTVESTNSLRDILIGKKVKGTGRHGKYFWLQFSPHDKFPVILLMHMGMTGNIKIEGVESHMIMMENGGDKRAKEELELENKKPNKVIVKRRKIRTFKRQKLSDLLIVQTSEGTMLTGVPVARDTLLTLKNCPLRNVKVEDILLMNTEHDGVPDKEIVEESYIEEEEKTDAEQVNELNDTSQWPPKHTRFDLVFVSETDPDDEVKVAFIDPRRLGRIWVFSDSSCISDERLLKRHPLDKLGPDYSKDPNFDKSAVKEYTTGDPDPNPHDRPRLGFEAFSKLILSRKRAIKVLLLDQNLFAGIGNWVADEILYHARLHPNELLSTKIKQPTNTLMRKLYDAIIYVMEYCVKVEANVKEYPKDWLMLYRWGKARKKVQATTKAGLLVKYETVNGRTSSYVPELQKFLEIEVVNDRRNDTAKN